MTGLGDYLATGGRRTREAGIWDCCTLVADWAMLCGHSDPMAGWRGRYGTEAEGEALISEAARKGEGVGHSGLECLFLQGFWQAGVPEILRSEITAGDIGLVRFLVEEAGAIYTGKRWALVAERGLAFVSLDLDSLVRVWRPSHG